MKIVEWGRRKQAQVDHDEMFRIRDAVARLNVLRLRLGLVPDAAGREINEVYVEMLEKIVTRLDDLEAGKQGA